MRNWILRIIDHLIGRVTGPMTFRIFLQPGMALFFGIRDGLRDARENRPPYFWALFTKRADRAELIRSGWQSIARVFILAIVMDIIYQFIVFRWFYVMETILVALILAVMPYVLVRGIVNRLARGRYRARQNQRGS